MCNSLCFERGWMAMNTKYSFQSFSKNPTLSTGAHASCKLADSKDNKYHKVFPYFISAILAQPKLVGAEKVSGFLGVFVHVTVWICVVITDSYLLGYEFQKTNSMLHMLQMAALVTVAIAGGTVIVCTLVHWLFGPYGFFPSHSSRVVVVCWNEVSNANPNLFTLHPSPLRHTGGCVGKLGAAATVCFFDHPLQHTGVARVYQVFALLLRL